MKAISLALSLLAIIGGSLLAAEKPSQAAAPTARKPNLIWIMADDKYESAGPKAENLRKSRRNARISPRFQIAGNHGKFRGTTGN